MENNTIKSPLFHADELEEARQNIAYCKTIIVSLQKKIDHCNGEIEYWYDILKEKEKRV